MDETIIVNEFFNTMSDFVIFKKELFLYFGQNRIFAKNNISLEEFIKDESLYDTIIKSEFNKFSFVSAYKFSEVSRKNLIQYYSKRHKEFGDHEINIYRQILPEDIESFYKFEVWLEIKGVRVSPGQYIQAIDYPEDVAITFPDKKHWHLGRKQIPAPMEPRWIAHLIPKKDIDKIIGIKRYKEIKWLGTEKENDFTGEQEETVLDLKSFDKNIYQIFVKHEAITVTSKIDT